MGIRLDTPFPGGAHIIIDKQDRRNALDLAMFEALAETWPRLENDRSVRVVLLSGAGQQAFCSGADLSADLGDRPGMDDLVERAFLKTAIFPKPIVAAITGHCVAGGLELMLSTDIRIASATAMFGLPEVRWGIVPSGGAAMKLADQIGYAHAMDLLLSGRLIDAPRAAAIGLIGDVVPAGDVLSVAVARAGQIAQNSPVAVAATKRSAIACRSVNYSAREPKERELVASVRSTGHHRAGIQAFFERRTPIYDD